VKGEPRAPKGKLVVAAEERSAADKGKIRRKEDTRPMDADIERRRWERLEGRYHPADSSTKRARTLGGRWDLGKGGAFSTEKNAFTPHSPPGPELKEKWEKHSKGWQEKNGQASCHYRVCEQHYE